MIPLVPGILLKLIEKHIAGRISTDSRTAKQANDRRNANKEAIGLIFNQLMQDPGSRHLGT